MNLESLNNSKFGAFKGKEVTNPLAVTGGRNIGTSYVVMSGGQQTGSGRDNWEYGPDRSCSDSFKWGEYGDMTNLDEGGNPDPIDPEIDYEYTLD